MILILDVIVRVIYAGSINRVIVVIFGDFAAIEENFIFSVVQTQIDAVLSENL